MDVLKNSLNPFVARYGTRLNIDLDMFEQLTGVELVYAISAKVNEAVGFDNETREMVEEFTKYIDGEWKELEETFDTNLVNTVSDKVDSLVSDGTMANLIGEHRGIVLIFGDSWTDPNSNTNHPNYYEWVTNVTTNPRIKTFGVGGATIPDISNQITKAANDSSFINDEVTDIFIVCGVNQITDTDTLVTDMNAIVETMNTEFPNAKISWGLNTYTPLSLSYFTSLTTCSEINTKGTLKCNFIPLPVILNRPIYYSNDDNNATLNGHKIYGFHLSEKGSNVMERVFYSTLSGSSFTPYIINSPDIELVYTDTLVNSKPTEFNNKKLIIKSLVESGSTHTISVLANINNISEWSVIEGSGYIKVEEAPTLDFPLTYDKYAGGFYGCTINTTIPREIKTINGLDYVKILDFTFITIQNSGGINFVLK